MDADDFDFDMNPPPAEAFRDLLQQLKDSKEYNARILETLKQTKADLAAAQRRQDQTDRELANLKKKYAKLQEKHRKVREESREPSLSIKELSRRIELMEALAAQERAQKEAALTAVRLYEAGASLWQ